MTHTDQSTTLVYEFEVNRADLSRNGCPMPDDWSLDDLIYADRLGLIYGYECTQIREAAPDDQQRHVPERSSEED